MWSETMADTGGRRGCRRLAGFEKLRHRGDIRRAPGTGPLVLSVLIPVGCTAGRVRRPLSWSPAVSLPTRIALDRLLLTPVAVALDGAAFMLGRVLRRDHRVAPETTRRIVVAKLVGLGSLVQASALIRALRERFPRAEVVVFTLRGNAEIASRLPGVDRVLTLDDRTPMRMLASTVRAVAWLVRARVDHYLDLELYSRFASTLAVCSVARNRLGLYRRSMLFRRGIYTHLAYFNTRLPVAQSYLQLAHMLECPADDPLPSPLRLDAADHAALAREVPALASHVRESLVVLNANASDLLLERRWPVPHVVALVEQLLAVNLVPVLIGAPHERAYVDTILSAMPPATRAGVLDVCGRTSIAGLLALLSRAGLVITNDSGPMHLSIALGTPTVSLWGPGTPDHYGIERDNVRSMYAGVPCSPCLYEIDTPPCRGDNICMQRLTPEMVFDVAMELTGRGSRDTRTPVRLPVLWTHPVTARPLGTAGRGD
jgi:ADP-heptose:LPS heptosyltransferase